MMGPRGKVDEKTRHIAAAAAWGLFPEWDATYLNYSGGHDHRLCHKAAYEVPEYDAFWSITVYGRDGFMKKRRQHRQLLQREAERRRHVRRVLRIGRDLRDVPNRLDVTEGWNFLTRIYRPGRSVLEGAYTLPAAKPVR